MTAFPESWRVIDYPLLPQTILKTLLKKPSPNTTVDDIIKDIVMAGLEFEPLISTFSGNRSDLDAFGDEIAFVVGFNLVYVSSKYGVR